jgi:hypothetical protein
MNSDILKRIVRAIAEGSQGDLERLAQTVVESERKVGHTKLAEQLDAILKRPRPSKNAQAPANENGRGLKDLPTSRRHGESLVTLVPRESLEHVLPGSKRNSQHESDLEPTVCVQGRPSCFMVPRVVGSLSERNALPGTWDCHYSKCDLMH